MRLRSPRECDLGYRNLILDLEGRLAVVTVNRPDVRNALDTETVAGAPRGALEEYGGPAPPSSSSPGPATRPSSPARTSGPSGRAGARRRAGLHQLPPHVRGGGPRGGDDRRRQRGRPGGRMRAGPRLRPADRGRARGLRPARSRALGIIPGAGATQRLPADRGPGTGQGDRSSPARAGTPRRALAAGLVSEVVPAPSSWGRRGPWRSACSPWGRWRCGSPRWP